jgi:hypothetical protein
MKALDYIVTALGHYQFLEKTEDNEQALHCLRLAIEELNQSAYNVFKEPSKNVKVEIFTGKHTTQQINEWLAKNSVRIITVETIAKASGGDGLAEVNISKAGTRIWYEDLKGS